jgi:exodeoxyribonuclease VII large subunit
LQRQDDLRTRLDRAMFTGLANQSLRLAALNARLEGLNPLAVLRRGFALLSDATSGAIVSHAASAKSGQLLQARLQDGSLSVEVKNVRTEGENHE